MTNEVYCPCGHVEDGDKHACPITHGRLQAEIARLQKHNDELLRLSERRAYRTVEPSDGSAPFCKCQAEECHGPDEAMRYATVCRKAWDNRPAVKSEAEPCEHLRSELLAEKQSAEPPFEMRKCLDCKQIFRVRLTVRTGATPA